MDPLHLAVAFLPLAAYLIGLGAIHLRRRPTIWSGAFDTAALAAAVSGLIVAGPMELFLPESSPLPGAYLWLLMLALYVLCVTLWNLMARPRVVIFNITLERLQPALAELCVRMDEKFTATGDSYMLPQIGVQFHVERYMPLHNVSLVAIGDQQSLTGWRRLQTELARSLGSVGVASRVPGYSFLFVGALTIAATIYLLGRVDGTTLVQQLRELLRQPAKSEAQLPAAPSAFSRLPDANGTETHRVAGA
ncbi:MAG TPA: hypothetical protein VGY55_17750 [Pirellulales bacterium]|jgi:hypothetical protein|nr:hypothetical protein [Pirellulales bacterium]